MSATPDSSSSSHNEKSGVSRRAILLASSAAAAGIAGQKLGETPAMAAGVAVSHGHSVGFNWNIPKDSPDGSKVLYVRFPGGNPAPAPGTAEIWYASPTGANRTKIPLSGFLANNHSGAHMQFIDNQRIVYRHRTSTTDHTRVVNINGNIVQNWSNLAGVIPIDYNPTINKIVAGVSKPKAQTGGPLSNMYLLDPDTGAANKIFDVSALTPWQSILGGAPADWNLWHRYMNPAGTLIWMKIGAPNFGPNLGGFGFTCNASGGDIKFFDAWAGHATWWNNNVIVTNEPAANGNPARVVIRNRVGGLMWVAVPNWKANHLGTSPLSASKRLIATDWYWWPSPEIRVHLHKPQDPPPLTQVFSSIHDAVVKAPGMPHGAAAHTNPSFSRNNQRLYANQPVAVNETRLMSFDISQWA